MTPQAKAMQRAIGKPISLVRAPWDHGASGQANQASLVIEQRGDIASDTGRPVNPNKVTGARRMDPLDLWHGRGTITTNGLNAAKALRLAYENTMRGAPALPDNDRVQSSPKPDVAISILLGRISDFSHLMSMVDKTDRLIVTVCVLDGGHPREIYGAKSFRDGFRHLKDALDKLHDRMSYRR